MNAGQVTPFSLRLLADQLQAEAQGIDDYLDGCGWPTRDITAARRQHVQPRFAAAGALRNAAGKLAAVLPTSIGEL